MQKIDPVVGMAVTWINPESNQSSMFIRNYLMREFGTYGLTVESVERTSCGFLVTLCQNGKALVSKKFDWHWLRPVLSSWQDNLLDLTEDLGPEGLPTNCTDDF